MSTQPVAPSPALIAAARAQEQILECLKAGKSFCLEAGAGSGKTYSLVEALKWLIANRGRTLARENRKIACITYTNVAAGEILSRIDRSPVVAVSTIHAFCWNLMGRFQPYLRDVVPKLKGWDERLKGAGRDTRGLRIEYELGHQSINEDRISLGHNDVIALAVGLLGEEKFRKLFVAKFPVIFIDEYQDTNKEFGEAILGRLLGTACCPIIGLFGDHWQRIYLDGCGKLAHPTIKLIEKGANFRSVPAVVNLLNKLRPDLPQEVKDPRAEGSVVVYHTNEWSGERQTRNHWQGDLPEDEAQRYLKTVKARLEGEAWDFGNPKENKILMLTNNLLAREQNYGDLGAVFEYPDSYLKKENVFIKFFAETIEPMCGAFQSKKYGQMFAVLGRGIPTIRSHSDKQRWTDELTSLVELREKGTVGDVVGHLRRSQLLHLPGSLLKLLEGLAAFRLNPPSESGTAESDKGARRFQELERLLAVKYSTVSEVVKYIDDMTPFSTKHGVKGQEFENVLVVFTRGWNQYDFSQMLEWYSKGVPTGKETAFERNRNLFYVSCSRAKRRLVLLFTQKLSPVALGQLESWIGKGAVVSLGASP